MIKVLILSNTAWDNSNSFGSTFSNFFEGMDDVRIANIYCRSGSPNNGFDMRCFQITEKSLLKNLRNRSCPPGREVYKRGEGSDVMNAAEQKRYDSIRKTRLMVFHWAQELIWLIGRDKSDELKRFIDDFDPDVIFQPIYNSFHLTRLARFIIGYTGKPAVGFIGDDLYTLKRFNLSPLFWIDRLLKRPRLKKLIKACESVFVMTGLQKREYDGIFGINCGILTKSADFSGEPGLKTAHEPPFVFTYTGNIYTGRYKALSALGRALGRLKEKGIDCELRIYTLDPLTRSAEKAFALPAIKLMGGASSQEIPAIQAEADALVFADGNTLKSMGVVRHSFSTKLVDYMKAARCIVAIGPEGIAPIDHLKENGAAIVITDLNDILPAVEKLVSSPESFGEYGMRAWECGRKNHSKSVMRKRLHDELCRVSGKGMQ
ncbi:MAG: hypothetical protein IKP26_00825 [Clostridia bacterium]|nr:hypothetical protein [Clostridia bacterium]